MSSVNVLAEFSVLLLVAQSQVKSQKGNDKEQCRVAAEMDGEGFEVARIVVEEDLGSSGVTGTPSEEVKSDADGLFGLPANISSQQAHTETLCSPEGEDDPVADE